MGKHCSNQLKGLTTTIYLFDTRYFQSQQKEDDQEMAGHFTRMAARSRDLRHSSNQEGSANTCKTY